MCPRSRLARCRRSADADSTGLGCYWENAYGNPKLWVREYPATDAPIISSLSEDTQFWGTKYNAYNDGEHWVQVNTGGWANADYLLFVKGWDKTYTKAFCTS
jgi:hypothetical protein